MHRRDGLETDGMTTFRTESRQRVEPPDRNGVLSLQRCRRCGRYPTYPRVRCPICLGELRWVSGTGIGKIVDVAVVHRPQDVRYEPYLPIVLAHIALSEDVEVIATIIGADRLKSKIGDRVVVCRQRGWSPLPQFELKETKNDGANV
jgi:uncharacterized OB-fold protein